MQSLLDEFEGLNRVNVMFHLLLYFVAILSLSQAGNLVRLANAPAEVIGFWRLLSAAIIILPLAWYKGDLKHLLKKSKEIKFVLLTGVLFFLHLWSYFYSVQNTKIANSMIIFATNPLFTALGASLIFKEKFTKRLALAYLLAFTGIFQLIKHHLNFDPELNKGNLSALISALFFSGYILSSNQSRKFFSNSSFAFLKYLVTACLFGITAWLTQVSFTEYPSITWMAIAGTVVFPTLLGHALFTYLLKFLNINWMSCGKLIEPVLSAAVAFFLFNENLSLSTLLAFAFTSASVLVLFLPGLKGAKKN